QAAERSASFLADASEALDASLEEGGVLRSLVTLPVPRLGDWCVVDVADPDQGLRRVAVTHADQAKASAARTLAARYPAGVTDLHGPGRVLRTGEIELFSL